MQLAPAAPVAPVQPPLWGPDVADTYVGVAIYTSDAEGTVMDRKEVRLGQLVGMPNGHSSLDDAITAARELTRADDDGNEGAAAVVAHGDRYYTAAVLEKEFTGSISPPGSGGWDPFEVEDGTTPADGDAWCWSFPTSKHLVTNGVMMIVDGDSTLFEGPYAGPALPGG